ncbi:zinc finger CCCH-type with G patch domain-containing protein-like [Corticium candelabrum]|uniref:zinc finger CCCH-type with G patch domain-containing protein-like n=1 Tax=Corticium candelabrum TaxID=121492 RepID=UPI002E27197C|nr:zinc finger CCCH-type with G patch domain-containing protein-like [Corticium candelabrum]
MADETTLETALEGYKQQIAQVELAVASCVNEVADPELLELKENLYELVQLTEGALLSAKKSKLLGMLNSDDTFLPSSSTEIEETSNLHQSESEESFDDEDDNEDVCGRQCRAPFEHPWGSVDHYNAIIVCPENDDRCEEDDTYKVRVVFTHPVTESMVPCQYYLSGKCKFSDSDCRRSHGQVVDINTLEEYEEADYTKLTLGSHCLVKQEDGIWQPGTINAIVEGCYQVKLSAVNKDVAASPQELWPLCQDDETADGENDRESDINADDENDSQGDQPTLRTLSTVSNSFGEWEKHTSGIGSKLLHKMGFLKGQGLGRSKNGIKEPIDIVVLPTGKSLDVCALLREKNRLHKPFKRKKAKLVQETTGSAASVFDFINYKLGSNIGQPGVHPRKHKSKAKGPEGASYFHFDDDIPIKKQKTNDSRGSNLKLEGNLNVKLVKIQEQLRSLEKRLTSLQQSLDRNMNKDKKMTAHVQEKITACEREQQQLAAEEKRIQSKLKQQSSDKKLRCF